MLRSRIRIRIEEKSRTGIRIQEKSWIRIRNPFERMQEMLVKDRLEAVLCSRSRGAEIKWPPGPLSREITKSGSGAK